MRSCAASALTLALAPALALAGPPTEAEARVQWQGWKQEYGRRYASAAEEDARFANFRQTLREIDEFAAANPLATFGTDEWSDWSDAERRSLRGLSGLSLPPPDDESTPTAALFSAEEVARAEATSIDWRKKGAVTSVKNQGKCGSCGDFSSVGNMEGQWFLAGNPLISLSEQELVSCKGMGWMAPLLKWVVSNGGIASEKTYPYTGCGGSCSSTKKKEHAAKFTGTEKVTAKEAQILAYMQKNGPVSIALNAAFGSYKSGILSSCPSNKDINHAILIVGYGTSGSTKYWIIKNSWGTGFGEKGYIRIKYGSNQCNLQSGQPVSAKAAAPPPPVPPDAARYHCDKASKQCVVAVAGHSTVGACLTACASTVPPDAVRYHCDKTLRQCIAQESGHSTVATCLATCQGTNFTSI